MTQYMIWVSEGQHKGRNYPWSCRHVLVLQLTKVRFQLQVPFSCRTHHLLNEQNLHASHHTSQKTKTTTSTIYNALQPIGKGRQGHKVPHVNWTVMAHCTDVTHESTLQAVKKQHRGLRRSLPKGWKTYICMRKMAQFIFKIGLERIPNKVEGGRHIISSIGSRSIKPTYPDEYKHPTI